MKWPDLALKLLEERPMLAFDRSDGETGLHVLAQRPPDSGCQCPRYRKLLMNCCCVKESLVIQLFRRHWCEILRGGYSMMRTIIRQSSHIMFEAAEDRLTAAQP